MEIVHVSDWNSRYAARSYVAHEISKLDFVALETAARVKLAEPARACLVSAVNGYYTEAAYLEGAPDTEIVRRRIAALEKHTRTLTDWLSPKNSADRAILDEAFPWRSAHPGALGRILWRILGNLRGARERLRAGPGRPGDDPRRGLLRTLHGIYRESGGVERGVYWHEHEGKHAGPFLDLARELFRQAGIRTENLAGLALEAAREAPRRP